MSGAREGAQCSTTRRSLQLVACPHVADIKSQMIVMRMSRRVEVHECCRRSAPVRGDRWAMGPVSHSQPGEPYASITPHSTLHEVTLHEKRANQKDKAD